MAYKVIHWNTGFVGSEALKYVLANKDLELVGLKCWSESKEGQDAGDLVGMPPVGIKATRDADALLAMDADCVVYMPNDGPGCDTTFAQDTDQYRLSREHFEMTLRILESGKNVVTPITTATHFLHYRNPEEFIGKIEVACAKGNSSIHYAGVDPGFFTDQLALNLAAGCGIVNRIETWEVMDYGTVNYEEEYKRMGFGKSEQELDLAQKTKFAQALWGGVPHLVARALRVPLDETQIDVDFWVSPEDYIASGGFAVKAGTIGAFKLTVTSLTGGKPFHVINHVTRIGPHSGPDWPNIGTSGKTGGYRVEIFGSTPMCVDIPLGMPGGLGDPCADGLAITAAVVVNRIRDVVEAPPGYQTFLDLKPFVPTCIIPV